MSKHGSHSSNGAKCEPCVKKSQRGHKDARVPKYCSKHQCPVVGSGGIVCCRRKKGLDEKCEGHSTCEFKNCSSPRISDETGIPYSFCFEHACMSKGCAEGKVYDPKDNTHGDLCASHTLMICALPNCLDWKAEGNFCKQHTCIVDQCGEKAVQDRPLCPGHNRCTVPQCRAEKLQRADRFENVCQEHYIPPCRLCPKKSQKHSRYCSLHSCRYQGCTADARPALQRPYCDVHRCHSDDCLALPNFSEVNGELRINTFCTYHECQAPYCINHTTPDKPGAYCASHCCTTPKCMSARDGDPRFGTVCLAHYEEKIAETAKQKLMEEMAAKMRLDEQYAAQAKEAEQQRQGGRVPRPYYQSSRQDYPTNSYDEEEYDEGYRSNRNSDSYNQPRQRHSGQGGDRGW